MKKETKRFETKEIKKSKYMNEDVQKITSFLIVLVIVGIFIAGLFYINGKYVTKDEFQNSSDTEEVKIDEKLITLDDILSCKDDEYYVLAYSLKDLKVASSLTGVKNSYSKALYYVNLDDAINKNHYNSDKEENIKVKNVDELMLNKPTLIKIKNKQVISYSTDIEEIINTLSKKA